MEVVVGGGGGGEKMYAQNLRDFLRIEEEDHRRNRLNQSTSSSSGGGGVRNSSSGLTLSAILSDKIGLPPPVDEPLRRVESNRTLLDIIREEQTTGLGRGVEDSRRRWRHLKNKIRLRGRGGGSAWPVLSPPAVQHRSFRLNSNTESGESSQPDSIVTVPLRNRRPSTESTSWRFEQSTTTENTDEERRAATVEVPAEGDGSPEQPVRMSLMALLAENDRQMGYDSSAAYMMDEDETEDNTEEKADTSTAVRSGMEYDNCCVCMVRHKGAAFIPCGHTFCRLCSRELWLQRGNCPLCNNLISEVLDIF